LKYFPDIYLNRKNRGVVAAGVENCRNILKREMSNKAGGRRPPKKPGWRVTVHAVIISGRNLYFQITEKE
jgi:hypothetical protein